MSRELKIIDLSLGVDSKTLRVSLAGHEYSIGFQAIEIDGFGNQWLVLREDLDLIFGNELQPYYAPLFAELASQQYAKNQFSVDLDELDKIVGMGRSIKDAIALA